jgi:hypothetical protein
MAIFRPRAGFSRMCLQCSLVYTKHHKDDLGKLSVGAEVRSAGLASDGKPAPARDVAHQHQQVSCVTGEAVNGADDARITGPQFPQHLLKAAGRKARHTTAPCHGQSGDRLHGPRYFPAIGNAGVKEKGAGYDRLGVIGIVAMLVHATGAPAFSAASSGGSSVSQ